MFYVILTIVILVVFGTILAAPKQPKEQTGGDALEAVKNSIDSLANLRTTIEGLKDTIMNIAPALPTQGNIIQDITTTLNEFQTNFITKLDTIYSDVKFELLGEE